jgi:hypothetical protein
MAFVNEKIGNDYRTIDYERDLALTYHGTGGDYPHEFKLRIGGKFIKFEAWLHEQPNAQGKLDVRWDVVRLFIVEYSQEQKIEIMQMIREALSEFGAFATREGVNNVVVNFKTPEMN